jgi:hypothetical protein
MAGSPNVVTPQQPLTSMCPDSPLQGKGINPHYDPAVYHTAGLTNFVRSVADNKPITPNDMRSYIQAVAEMPRVSPDIMFAVLVVAQVVQHEQTRADEASLRHETTAGITRSHGKSSQPATMTWEASQGPHARPTGAASPSQLAYAGPPQPPSTR